MTRPFVRKARSLAFAALFVSTAAILLTPTSLAQVQGRGAGQASGYRLTQGVTRTQGVAVSSLNRKESGVHQLDSENPLFLWPVTYGSGGAATSVAVADVNGDGRPDLVVANSSCYNCEGLVGVLLGNGDGTFQTVISYGSGGVFSSSIAVADVDGDGKLDIVVVSPCPLGGCPTFGTDGVVSVLLGNGNGTFRPALIYDAGAGNNMSKSLAVADVNGDGKPDLIVANYCTDDGCTSSSVGVLLGNGDGTFQPIVSYLLSAGPANLVAVADVNGDERRDLIIGTCDVDGGGSVGVLLGNGDGTFQSAVSYDSDGSCVGSVALSDVNGDGRLDVTAGTGGLGLVAVLVGNGDGSFQPPVTYDSGGVYPASVALADVNGDGKPDVVVGNCGAHLSCGSDNGAVGVLLGNGDGTFQPVVTFYSGGSWLRSLAVADLNGDGRPDVVTVHFWQPPFTGVNSVGVLMNNTGPHTPTTTALTSSGNPASHREVVTYMATVVRQSGGALTGTVRFYDGSAVIATVQLAGNQAAYSTLYNKTSIHPITASYSGDLYNSVSTSATLTEYVEYLPVSSETALTTSGSPSFVGQAVTFAAAVTWKYGTIPNGELVTFYDGASVRGTSTTASGVATFTTSTLTVKTHYITATHAGDATFRPSTGKVTQVVDKYTTTTALVSTLNPSTYGQAVTFNATVTSSGPDAPTGKVVFKDGTTAIGSGTLGGGVAALTRSKLAAGSHVITAKYEGDSLSAPSTSSALNQVVHRASTRTAITSSANPSSQGQIVTVTAKVTSSTGAHATGTVTFIAGAATLGTVALTGTIATISTATLPVGSTLITATYNRATDFAGSSASLTQTVQP